MKFSRNSAWVNRQQIGADLLQDETQDKKTAPGGQEWQ